MGVKKFEGLPVIISRGHPRSSNEIGNVYVQFWYGPKQLYTGFANR